MPNRAYSLAGLCKYGVLPVGGVLPIAGERPASSQKNGVPPLSRVILAVLAAASGLLSAEAIEPLKELRAPDRTQWTVTIVPKADARSVDPAKSKEKQTLPDQESPGAALVQSIGAKNRGIYRVQNRYSDQTEEDWWIISKYQHFKYKGHAQISRLLSSQNRAWNLEESDFPELYWAVGQTPELQEIEGQKWLVIRMDAAKKPLTKRQQRDLAELRQAMNQQGQSINTQNSAPGTLLLYLNPETGLPARFEDIDSIYTYSYDKSPDLRSIVPDDIKNEILAFEQKNSDLTRPPSAPKIRNPNYQKP